MRSSSRRRRRLARHGPSPFPLPELLLRLTDRWCRRRRSLRRGSRRGWWGRRGPRRRSRRGWRRWCGSRRRCCGRRWRRCRTGRRGCSGWRRRWPRRCRSGRRRGLWSSSGRWALWRLLGSSVGTELFLCLRHHQRRALRMRWRASELHRCEGCRGKQHEAKFGHDDLGLRENLGKKCRGAEPVGYRDQRPAIRPDCGGLPTRNAFYFVHAMGCMRPVHCPFRPGLQVEVHINPPAAS